MPDQSEPAPMFLIAEFCAAQFYSGWHIYLRESSGRQVCNKNGGWGWLRQSWRESRAHDFLRSIGIERRGDGTCDGAGYDEIAKRFPIPRQRIGGRPRGCIPVWVGEDGTVSLRAADQSPEPEKVTT